VRFAFEAAAWEQTLEKAIKLTKVFRQKDEGMNQAPQNFCPTAKKI
jgi:hypothetical protein